MVHSIISNKKMDYKFSLNEFHNKNYLLNMIEVLYYLIVYFTKKKKLRYLLRVGMSTGRVEYG